MQRVSIIFFVRVKNARIVCYITDFSIVCRKSAVIGTSVAASV